MKQDIKISLESSIVRIKYEGLSEIDSESLTSIHYENLYGELVTISTLLNRVGILKAEMDNRLREEKLDYEVYEAQTRQLFRNNAVAEGKKLTVQETEDMITLDQGIQLRKRKLLKLQKNCDVIDSLYWAVQSKDRKLSVMLKGITPQEFEEGIVEGVINDMEINKYSLQQPIEKK